METGASLRALSAHWAFPFHSMPHEPRHLVQAYVRVSLWRWIREDAERNGMSVAAWLRAQLEAIHERATRNNGHRST